MKKLRENAWLLLVPWPAVKEKEEEGLELENEERERERVLPNEVVLFISSLFILHSLQ